MFLLTLFVISIVFILNISLSILSYSYRNQPIPENVSDVYDEIGYKKWLNYTMENHRLSILEKIVNTGMLLLFLTLGIFPALANAVNRLTDDPILQTLLFLGVYFFISYILNIGFSWYHNFSIEERYGFNKSTIKTFILDQLKSILLTLVLGSIILYILLALYLNMGNGYLIYAWLVVASIMLAVNLLYTQLFIRIFNKLSPLPDGELKQKIEELAKNTGFEIKKISVMDASKRSGKLNAFFSGFGKFKHIVLYDTLLQKCTSDEIVSILAHEIGHAKHRDVLRNVLISLVQIAVYLVLMTFFLSSVNLANAFGFSHVHLGFSIVLFGILIEPIGIALGIPLSAYSRKAEYKADEFALQVGYKKAMISALKVLARENFSNLTPHPLVVRLTYSHPPISHRIEALTQS
ncbi:M48 family metallopeptidase [Dehalobacter sp. DCM]|uniref:M48 family metallopeptidase n=1 Tax=Dehalobacter sp. DCM TaxID=2907827 RepID=UPI003081823F|nr:M48 family metallopeptidase [Dehalobacter sp. DCM]